jgi:hypothetical protein
MALQYFFFVLFSFLIQFGSVMGQTRNLAKFSTIKTTGTKSSDQVTLRMTCQRGSAKPG